VLADVTRDVVTLRRDRQGALPGGVEHRARELPGHPLSLVGVVDLGVGEQ